MAAAHLLFSGTNLIRSPTSPPTFSYHKHKAVAAGVSQNLSYWDSIHSDIDSHLKKALPIREPISVFEPMHHLTFAPPKTTASALCVATCELVGGSREDAIKQNPRFGPNIELLTGDGILPFGFELLAGSMDPAGDNSDKILRVIIEITRAVGSQGMVDDQDFEGEFYKSSGQLRRRLHGCAAACGAILGGGGEEEIGRLKRYGVYAGKIQGLLTEMGRNKGGKMKLVEEWRVLALKELEYFDSKRIEQISTIVRV
ncbi:hypothetical protein LXL04_016299 [Taraxacum kok-saghyz]